MLRIILLAAASLVAVPAAAQSFYVGGHFGQATVDDFCDGLFGSGVSCDDSDTMWRIVGGFQANRHLAVEVAYTNLGEVGVRGPGGEVTVEATTLEFVAVGAVPLTDRVALYGKAGLYRGDTEARADTVIVSGTFSETNTDLTFGAGLAFSVADNVTLRGEWQRYTDVGGGEIGEADIDVVSLGVLVRF
jgi:OmpA-OmpF porin, OOP family